MRILYVRSGFAVKIQDAVPVKHDILDSAVGQGAEHHGAYADIVCNAVFIRQIGAFFLNKCAGFSDGLLQNVLELYHMALAGRHGAVCKGDHSEIDVLHILRPRVAHFVNHCKELFEVQVLLIGYNIEAFIEIVGIFAVKGGCEISRRIQRRAVAL